MSDAEDACVLDLPGTEDDCFCSEQCYSLLNCCQDILLPCSPRKKGAILITPVIDSLISFQLMMQNYVLCSVAMSVM